MSLKIAFYADDFTGATDTLSTLAMGGQRVMLFLREPQAHQLEQTGDLDCIGIAGASRSMCNDAQVTELASVAPYLVGTGAPVIHYKTCSTFDSSPTVGSIGVAVRTLRARLGQNAFVPIVGGQPSLGRYCVFGNVFAAFQNGKEVFRLDRHPTMSLHPVTPMSEADLSRHLASQGLGAVASVQYPSYGLSDQELDAHVDALMAEQPDAVLFDVAAAGNLAAVGRQIWRRAAKQPVLAVGPSSVEQSLLAYWNVAPCAGSGTGKAAGSTLVLSGSRSPLNERQIGSAASYKRVPMRASDLLNPASAARHSIIERLVEGLKAGHNMLAHLTHDDADSPGVSPAQLATATATLLRDLLGQHQPARLGLAGGDTSSHAIQALDVWGLSYVGQIDSGAALCRLHSDDARLDGLEVMLKGGQMGSLDVFERLCR